MNCHVQKFSIPYEYPVHFTRGVFDSGNTDFVDIVRRMEPDRRHRFFAVIDDGVAKAWSDLADSISRYADKHAQYLQLATEPMIIEGGEAAKNDPHGPAKLHRRFYELGLDRQSFVVIIGGGAIQDMVGYAAATTHRGLRVVRVPTTVLSQNDSGVGVKNGVNAFGVKNFLGAFAPPFAVLDDFDFIGTLSARDKLAGIPESIKVALIRDSEFFTWLRDHAKELRVFETEAMAWMIRRGAELHMNHIATSGDPFEMGAARPLDFGHWAGHKLESMSDYRLRHGEAVAIGMALDACYSAAVGMLPKDELSRIIDLLTTLGVNLWDDCLAQKNADGRLEVLRGLKDFQEHLGGDLTVTLLEGIGRGVEVHEIDEQIMTRCIEELKTKGSKG